MDKKEVRNVVLRVNPMPSDASEYFDFPANRR